MITHVHCPRCGTKIKTGVIKRNEIEFTCSCCKGIIAVSRAADYICSKNIQFRLITRS